MKTYIRDFLANQSSLLGAQECQGKAEADLSRHFLISCWFRLVIREQYPCRVLVPLPGYGQKASTVLRQGACSQKETCHTPSPLLILRRSIIGAARQAFTDFKQDCGSELATSIAKMLIFPSAIFPLKMTTKELSSNNIWLWKSRTISTWLEKGKGAYGLACKAEQQAITALKINHSV